MKRAAIKYFLANLAISSAIVIRSSSADGLYVRVYMSVYVYVGMYAYVYYYFVTLYLHVYVAE